MTWIAPFLTWMNNMVLTKNDFHRIEYNTEYLKILLR